MSEEKKNQLSRRDALKVLSAAAGATALANLPKKWDTPKLLSGVLPAHAQTSVCNAVTIELVSGNTELHYFSIAPDEIEWDYAPGSYANWQCQSGCLLLLFSNPVAPSSLHLTTISNESTIDFGRFEHYLLINMDTGEYALNFGTPPDGCEWPEIN
jgi:hypothetical protein